MSFLSGRSDVLLLISFPHKVTGSDPVIADVILTLYERRKKTNPKKRETDGLKSH